MNKKLALMVACCAIASLSACNESVPWTLPGTDCNKEGEKSCRGNEIVVCTNGRLVAETQCSGATPICDAATVSCVAAPATCTNGEKQCQGNDVRVCANGVWTTERCEGNTVCDSTTFECRARACTDGAYKCEENRLYVCGSETWNLYQTCAEDKICEADRGVCADRLPCLDDEPLCRGDQAINCINDHRSTKVCNASQTCIIDDIADTAVCVDKVCDEGARRCNAAGNAETCINNTWDEIVCNETQVCTGHQGCVTKICDEGASKCENNLVIACTNNAWTNAEACGAMTCVVLNDAAECVEQDCEPDTTRCNDDVVESCGADLQWEKSLVCSASEVCLIANDEAVCQAFVCRTDDLRCNGDTLETCVLNAWTTKDVCSATTNYICVPGLAADGGNPAIPPTCALKVCNESTTQCNTSNANLLDTCTRNAWVTSTCADIGGSAARCATSGTPAVAQCAVKVCDEGSQCVGNAVAYCRNNVFTYGPAACDVNTACVYNPDSSMADCVPVPYCGDNIVQTDLGETCDGTNLNSGNCRNVLGDLNAQGTLSCYPPGDPNQCTFNTSQCYICGNGIIEAIEQCDGTNLGGATCPGGTVGTVTCNADCTLNTSGCTTACTADVCASGMLQTCNTTTGVLSSATACAGGADCMSATACGNCSGSTSICASGMIQTCSGGVMGTATACAGGADCMSATACGNCAGTSTVCASGMLQTCSSGVLGTATACAGGADCSSASTCGNCSGSAFTCNGAVLQQCVSGTTTTINTCATAAMCDATNGVCNTPCTADVCNLGQLQTCNTTTGVLSSAAACAGGADCSSASTCGNCSGSTSICSGGMIQACSGGVMSAPTACAGGADCSSTSACGDCSGSGFTCNVGVLQQCVSGVTTTIDDCGSPALCDATNGVCGPSMTYSIDYAITTGFNSATSIMLGEVYSSGSPASTTPVPPAEIVAQIVCTASVTTDALGSWFVVQDAAYTGTNLGIGGNDYQFGGIIPASTIERYCLMRFSGDSGNTWSYAQANGSALLTATDVLTASGQAYQIAASASGTVAELLNIERYIATDFGTGDAGLLGRWGGVSTGEAGSATTNFMVTVSGAILNNPVDLDTVALAVNIKNIANITDYNTLNLSFRYGGSTATNVTNLTIGIYDGATMVGSPILVDAGPLTIVAAGTGNVLAGSYSIDLPASISPATLSVRIAATVNGGSLRLDDIIVKGILK